MKDDIAIIGQFPPPVHGLSKALDTLYKSRINDKYNMDKINITNNKKFLNNLFKIIVGKYNIYYLTIAQSRFGNIRDLIIIKTIQLKKKKIIIHLHGGGFREFFENDYFYIQKKLNYRILGNVDKAIVLGESLKKIFDGIIPKDRIEIVENCVDSEFILNDEKFNNKIERLDKKYKFKILYLSNFIEDKGYLKVIKIATDFMEKGIDKFEFIFAGKFFEQEKEEKFVSYISKLDNVSYLGTVYGEKKKKLLEECDLFILLTKYKIEGQPISIIEAMANGLYIITTDHAGIRDIVDKNNSYMFSIDEPIINIEKKLIEFDSDFERRKKSIYFNRRKVSEEFNEEKYIKKLLAIFNKVNK